MLTPGSVTRLFDVPGLAEHARGLKSTAEALYLRDHVLEQLELADVDDDAGRAAARRTIVVVGASYSGTELAVQLRALADSAAKQMDFDPADVKFVLLDLAEQVMPEVGEKLGAAAQRVLKSRGIDVRLGVTLKEVHAEHVVLSDDSLIRTHTVAWVTGVTGAPLIEKLGLPTEKGRLKVHDRPPGTRPSRRVRRRATPPRCPTSPSRARSPRRPRSTRRGRERCWRATSPPASATARRRTTSTATWGLVVDLGPRYAVANPLNIQLSGFAAKVVTRAYHLYAIPRFVNRWAVSLAYLTDVFFDRSVVSFGSLVAGGRAVLRQRGHPDAETGLIRIRRSGNATGMATYRVLNPKGEVVDTKDIESADDAHAWFVDQKADPELGWRMEVKADDGDWAFFDSSEGDRKY